MGRQSHGGRLVHATIAAMKTIVVNGDPRPLPSPATVSALLGEMGLTGRRIAVERNGEIVPKSNHAATALAEGDRIEIVIAVGGG